MNKDKFKVGIIYFDEIHIVPHFLGPVISLYNDPGFEVEILTYQAPHTFLFENLTRNGIPHSIVKRLSTYWYRQISEQLKKRKRPSPLYLFKKHKNRLLNKYDALIFNDINHEYLHNHKKDKFPQFILLMHGAGDRDYLIGEAYRDTVSKFDLITTSGKKVTRFFENMNLPDTKIEICGYQKFDVINKDNLPVFFNNNKPVVLYNPHFEKPISSWYRFGHKILEFFYHDNDYNLIFAPHINLFNKKGYLKSEVIDKKYFDKQNILIDLGSKHLVNMDYTLTADIYLGDVSSQIYEFLYRLRPAIFINTHKENWQTDPHYTHWQLGEVIDELSNLPELLKTAEQWHQKYIEKQKQAFEFTFKPGMPGEASENIKTAIKNHLLSLKKIKYIIK